jgi:hypothetical protein
MWKSIEAGDDALNINPIREPQDIPQVVQLAAILSFRVFRLVLKQYRPSEEENFNRKYLKEWRTRFFKKYKVNLLPSDLTI